MPNDSNIRVEPGERPDFKVLELLKEFTGLFKSLRYQRPRWPYCSKPWCPLSRIYLKDLGVFVESFERSPLGGEVLVTGQSFTSKILSSMSVGPGVIHGGFRTKFHETLTNFSTRFLGEEPPGAKEISMDIEDGEIIEVKDKVVVVGSGVSGLSAALAIAKYNLKVLLVDINSRPGGFLSKLSSFSEDLNDIVEKVKGNEKIEIVKGRYIGSYEEGKFILTERALFLVPENLPLVYAGGSESPPPVTYNNDLPGIVSADYMLELIKYGNFMPRRVAVVGSGKWSGDVAEEIASHGPKVYLVSTSVPNDLNLKNVEVVEADKIWFEGSSRIRYLRTEERKIEVDAVASAVEEYPIASPLYSVGYTPCLSSRGVLVPLLDIDRLSERDLVVPVGSVLGIEDFEFSRESGECAGALVAKELGLASEEDVKASCSKVIQALKNVYRCEGYVDKRPDVWLSGDVKGLQFVDLDEDIVLSDVVEAWEKGYRDMESMKRATGLGTGLDQGTFSAHSTVLIISYMYKVRTSTLGLFRSRPPHSLPSVFSIGRFRL